MNKDFETKVNKIKQDYDIALSKVNRNLYESENEKIKFEKLLRNIQREIKEFDNIKTTKSNKGLIQSIIRLFTK